jgi:predicted glycosyltransferase
MDDMLAELKGEHDIIILPRGREQAEHYKEGKFAGIAVVEKSMSLNDIIARCDLFIGAGGTMTREAAVLGCPTISVYQDELLDVDRYLISQGCMVHNTNPTADYVRNFLNEAGKRPPQKSLLEKGRKAYELIRSVLLEN